MKSSYSLSILFHSALSTLDTSTFEDTLVHSSIINKNPTFIITFTSRDNLAAYIANVGSENVYISITELNIIGELK